MNDDADVIRFLLQSDNRTDVLQLLRENEELDRYEIEEELDASRRTVIRTMDAVTDYGYVAKNDDKYELTLLGSYIVDIYHELISNVSVAQRFEPFLTHMPADKFDVDPRKLEDAELIVANEASPYALVDRTLSLRQKTSTIRHMSPIIEQKSMNQLAQRLQREESLTGDAIISQSALDACKNHSEYQNSYQRIVASDRVTLYVYPDTIPFMLSITEDMVAIGVAKDGRPFAQVLSDHPEVQVWAENTFEMYRNQSEAIT